MPISERLRSLLHRLVLRRVSTCFVFCGLAFLASAVGTVNFVYLLKANVGLVIDYGSQALGDGAAEQIFKLVCTGYASLACFLLFKACEHRLVDLLIKQPTHDDAEAAD